MQAEVTDTSSESSDNIPEKSHQIVLHKFKKIINMCIA
jgi:hypothetical protein